MPMYVTDEGFTNHTPIIRPAPATITNTPRPGDTPEQIAARLDRALNQSQKPGGVVRTFATGATRDTEEGKLDYEGFLSPLVIKAFAEYMHEKRTMPDGTMRASDNWQKGIPIEAYMKSMWRHFFSVWESYRGPCGDIRTELLALLFNVQGMLHELIKEEQKHV